MLESNNHHAVLLNQGCSVLGKPRQMDYTRVSCLHSSADIPEPDEPSGMHPVRQVRDKKISIPASLGMALAAQLIRQQAREEGGRGIERGCGQDCQSCRAC